MRFAILIAMWAACLTGGTQGFAQNLSLPAAVQLALQAHPSLRVADSGHQLAEASLAEAKSGRLPTLQLKGTLTHGNNPVYVFGSLLEQGRFGPQNLALEALNAPASLSNVRTELDAQLPLFDRRQTATRIHQASIGVERSTLQRQAMEQQVRFDVVRSYFGLISALAREDAIGTSVRMADGDVKHAADMKDAGLAVESDLLAARVQLADFRQQQLQAGADVASAIAALNVAMGQPIDARVTIETAMESRSFDLRPQDELIGMALSHRPDYLQAKAAIRFADQDVSSARATALPRIDVFGSYGASTGWSSGSTDYTAGASITINLFDAGRASRIDRAHASQEAAEAETERLASEIRLDVVRAHQNHIASEERVAVARLSVEQSEEVHRVVQNRYEAGLATITELLRAETATAQARMNLIAAEYSQRMSYANVLFATGTLTNAGVFAKGGAE